jgi:hypothetical protein
MCGNARAKAFDAELIEVLPKYERIRALCARHHEFAIGMLYPDSWQKLLYATAAH